MLLRFGKTIDLIWLSGVEKNRPKLQTGHRWGFVFMFVCLNTMRLFKPIVPTVLMRRLGAASYFFLALSLKTWRWLPCLVSFRAHSVFLRLAPPVRLPPRIGAHHQSLCCDALILCPWGVKLTRLDTPYKFSFLCKK